ncbi:hypothetical protein Hanom_Chr03g00272451 [Helianthus anomalus]
MIEREVAKITRHILEMRSVMKDIKVLFVFSAGKGLQSADHICRHLQEKR